MNNQLNSSQVSPNQDAQTKQISLRDFFRKNAIYTLDQEMSDSGISEVLKNFELKQIGEGTTARVYRASKQNWVIKEGRWDLNISLFERGTLKVPAESAEKFLQLFQYSFLPKPDEIKRQYSLYLQFLLYFGCFREDDRYFHPEKEQFIEQQRLNRHTMYDSKQRIEEFYSIKISDHFWEKLQKNDDYDNALLYYNFLPEEYLLYGKSITPENKEKETFFICQDFVEGITLHDYPREDLNEVQRDRLLLLALCTLYMHMAVGLVPDLRPRYIISEGNDWFSMTENIMVKGDDITFIDTRWFWHVDDNIVKRGLLIPELTLNSAKSYLVSESLP